MSGGIPKPETPANPIAINGGLVPPQPTHQEYPKMMETYRDAQATQMDTQRTQAVDGKETERALVEEEVTPGEGQKSDPKKTISSDEQYKKQQQKKYFEEHEFVDSAKIIQNIRDALAQNSKDFIEIKLSDTDLLKMSSAKIQTKSAETFNSGKLFVEQKLGQIGQMASQVSQQLQRSQQPTKSDRSQNVAKLQNGPK